MRLVDADAFAMYLQLVCKGNDMSAEKKVFSANGIIHMLQDMPTASDVKWIPCSERMPKQGQEVICQCRARIIKVLKLDANGDWYQDADHCYMSGFVIAWAELPEPYEVKEE